MPEHTKIPNLPYSYSIVYSVLSGFFFLMWVYGVCVMSVWMSLRLAKIMHKLRKYFFLIYCALGWIGLTAIFSQQKFGFSIFDNGSKTCLWFLAVISLETICNNIILNKCFLLKSFSLNPSSGEVKLAFCSLFPESIWLWLFLFVQ